MKLSTLHTTIILIFAGLLLTGSARAAGETATAEIEIKPTSGTLYKEVRRPVDLGFRIQINTPAESPKRLPLKHITLKLPTDLKFIPGNTPVCKDLTPMSNLAAGPDLIKQLCPNSVVGNGGAAIYIAKLNLPQAKITDPVLIAVYGGQTKKGPLIKIYGYSKTTNVGIYMQGVLQADGTLSIAVPVLSDDSAVSDFHLDFPGSDYPDPELRGRKGFAQAKCSTGKYNLNTSFVLGERTYPGGEPTTDSVPLVAPLFTQDCVGAAGTAKAVASVKGPAGAKKGQVKTYRITVRNPGTATLKGVGVKTSGKWLKGRTQKVGNLAPGASRTIVSKVRVLRSAKFKKTTVLKARVTAGNSRPYVVTKRVRIS